jgi:hypothetical protein
MGAAAGQARDSSDKSEDTGRYKWQEIAKYPDKQYRQNNDDAPSDVDWRKGSAFF